MKTLKRVVGTVVTVTLLVLAIRAIISALILAPRLSAEEPETVIETYMTAQSLGLVSIAEEARSDELNETSPLPQFNEIFLVSGVTYEGPSPVAGTEDYEEIAEFKVTYTSKVIEPGTHVRVIRLGRTVPMEWRIINEVSAR